MFIECFGKDIGLSERDGHRAVRMLRSQDAIFPSLLVCHAYPQDQGYPPVLALP